MSRELVYKDEAIDAVAMVDWREIGSQLTLSRACDALETVPSALTKNYLDELIDATLPLCGDSVLSLHMNLLFRDVLEKFCVALLREQDE